MKKLISMLMAGAMILSLAVPALAEGESGGSGDSGSSSSTSTVAPAWEDLDEGKLTGTTTMTGATAGSTLSISLPKMGDAAFILNPYRLTYTDEISGHTLATNTDQVISPVYYIKAVTDAPLTVGIKATTKITSKNLKSLATAAVKAGDTGNNVYLRALFTPTTGTTAPTSWDSAKVLVLKAGDVTLDAKQQPVIAKSASADAVSSLAFKFDGSASSNPIIPWTDADKITVTFAWTFMPGPAVTT